MASYRFDRFEFDAARLRLSKDDKDVQAQPRVLELLSLLIKNRHRVVTKKELISTVWQGRAVSEDAISKCVAKLRKALDDTGAQKRLIRSSYARGWQFIGEVGERPEAARVQAHLQADQSPLSQTADGTDQLTARPGIAVLSFRSSGEPGIIPGITDALPDDITSSLVKLRSLRVIARASSFSLAKEGLTIPQIASSLNADYVLTGRIELASGELVVYAELVRPKRQDVIWSERFEGRLDELHAFRHAIVGQIVNRVEVEIPKAEAARASLVMPSLLGAWEAYHLGQSLGIETTKPDPARAALYFEKAVETAPDFARAHSALAFMHYTQFSRQNDREANRDAMLRHSEMALQLEHEDPMVHLAFGVTRAALGDNPTGMKHVSTALELAPNLARAHASLAGLQAANGKLEESLASVDRAVTLSPLDPHRPTWLAIRLVSDTLIGRLDEVRETAIQLSNIGVDQIVPLGWALVGFGFVSDRKNEEMTAERLRKITPAAFNDGIPGDYDGLPPPMRHLLREAFRKHNLAK